VDQLAARTLGKDTQFASLELSTENNNGGAAHVGPVFKSATTPLPFENNPRYGCSSGCSAMAGASIRPRPRRGTRRTGAAWTR
jgi:hypothetical protein